MKTQTAPLFPLSSHTARTHYDGGEAYTESRVNGITPSQLRRAYSYDANFDGDGMKIAIITAFDNVAVQQNMNVFCEEFGLPVPKMSVYYPDGRADNTTNRWLMESSLDTQWAHVFAPSAEICVVFAKSSDIESLMSAVFYASDTLGAHIISMSFGTEESATDGELSRFFEDSDSIFVASSGDRGCSVSFPSSNPFVVSVGGTRPVFNMSGTRIIDEYAWKNSGGGTSDIFSISPWQSRFADISVMTGGKRGMPDLSMMASTELGAAVYSAQLGGWTTVGGTSLSAACFAGVCACIRQNHPEIKKSGDMSAFLYDRAGGDKYALPQYSFRDITIGMSGNCRAFSGWDFASGLGSPVIRRLVS